MTLEEMVRAALGACVTERAGMTISYSWAKWLWNALAVSDASLAVSEAARRAAEEELEAAKELLRDLYDPERGHDGVWAFLEWDDATEEDRLYLERLRLEVRSRREREAGGTDEEARADVDLR